MHTFFITILIPHCFFFFFFNDTATTEIYTLSLHDALPIFDPQHIGGTTRVGQEHIEPAGQTAACVNRLRSEEHTSELQSQSNLVCRLLLEKKKKKTSQALYQLSQEISIYYPRPLERTRHVR